MEDIVSLQNQIEAAVRANDALTAKAKVEARAFTPAEQTAFDKNAADIKTFKDRIAYAQGVEPKTDVEEQIAALITANEALTLKRETEHRAFTAEEQAAFDKNAANIKAFRASVAYPRGVEPWTIIENQIDAVVKANDALTAKVKGESRAFTPAEQAAFDKNAADIEALKASVAYPRGVEPWPIVGEQIAAAVKANDALTAKAKGESRAFTPAEQAAFDKNVADIEALRASVADRPGFRRQV